MAGIKKLKFGFQMDGKSSNKKAADKAQSSFRFLFKGIAAKPQRSTKTAAYPMLTDYGFRIKGIDPYTGKSTGPLSDRGIGIRPQRLKTFIT